MYLHTKTLSKTILLSHQRAVDELPWPCPTQLSTFCWNTWIATSLFHMADWRGGGSCTGSECQRLDSHDSFITLTAKSPLLHVCVQSDAQCPEGGAAERVSAVLTEGNLQRCISTGQWCLMSPPPTLNSYVVYWHKCEWTSLHVLCWDFMAPPQETKRLLLSWRRNNPPIHHGMNTKWVLRWRSPPPQGRQSKVTSWKKSSIKIRWFLKQTSVH